MTRIISLTNNKGGTGKTTSTLNIGVGLARQNKKVLVIDLDPQANLTLSLGVDPMRYLDTSINQVLEKKATLESTIIKNIRGVDLVPSNMNLNGTELAINGVIARETILKQALESVKDNYDYILLDTPPSLNLLTLNSLTASTEVMIPIEPEYLALQGTKQLIDTINAIRSSINPSLYVSGVFITKFDKRKNLNKEVYEAIKGTFTDTMFKSIINTNVALAEAPSHNLDIFSYDSTSTGAMDYEALVKEIIKQERN